MKLHELRPSTPGWYWMIRSACDLMPARTATTGEVDQKQALWASQFEPLLVRFDEGGLVRGLRKPRAWHGSLSAWWWIGPVPEADVPAELVALADAEVKDEADALRDYAADVRQ